MIVKQLQEQKLVEPEVLFQCGLYLTRLVSLAVAVAGSLTGARRHSLALAIYLSEPERFNAGCRSVPSWSAGLFRRLA
jgi:hypothetical protein